MAPGSESKERSKAPQGHAGRFTRLERPRNAADKVIRELAVNDRPETLIALFDGRASYHTIRNWRRGKNGMPQWAIDHLRAKHDARGAMLADLKPGPGRSAGWRNIGAWRAAQNSD